jgi:hypothetical protein
MPAYTKITCIGCQHPKMDWREQRRQYGRMLRHGLTAAEANRLMPRCQKCTTIVLSSLKAERVGDVGDPPTSSRPAQPPTWPT